MRKALILVVHLLFLVTWRLAAAHTLSIAVSVPPLATLAREVGQGSVEAFSLLRPGDNPVTFAPTPRQMARLSSTDLYLLVGVPFERAWIARIRALNPRMQLVDVRRGLPLLPLVGHHHDQPVERETQTLDPHVWTDPIAVIRMAENIRDALTRLDPQHTDDYSAGARKVRRAMLALDGEIRERLRGLETRAFLVFHPAWGYFARRYGLTQLAIEHEGKQAGAHWMTEVIEKARKAGIRLILIQPQFDQRLARQVARAIGGEVATVDPLDPDYAKQIARLATLLTTGASPK
ncbi:MAG: ABC transporter substrate-binding protein [Gammaproteobacteria bacterium]|nr:MAG: ABC transporter substrate-binding protein [Gammaproteobacteria bacterium]